MRNHLGFLVLVALLAFGGIASAQQQLTLGQVTSFDTSTTGDAGSEGPDYLAFKREVAKGEKARSFFERALKQGVPAARLYSALGLYNLDPERGRQALVSLQSDTAPVTTTDGCEMEDTTVGKVAQRLLAEPAAIRSYLPNLK